MGSLTFPERATRGENPLQLDSQTPRMKVQEYLSLENRFKMLTKSKPEQAKEFFDQAQYDAENRWQFYQYLAARDFKKPTNIQKQTHPKDNEQNLKPKVEV